MDASVFIVGPDDGSGHALHQLCSEIGFRHVLWLGEIAEAEEQTKTTPTCFFVFSSGLAFDHAREIAFALRSSRNRQIQFAPLMNFCEQPTRSSIRDYLSIGFDDILIPPFHAGYVLSRMRKMLEQRSVFYETDNYFGPDRRRKMDAEEESRQMRGNGGTYRRIELTRDVRTGVKILREQRFDAPKQSSDLNAFTHHHVI